MNFNDFFGGLTGVLNWIETYIINGFLGQGFQIMKNGIFAYQAFKPLFDLFAALFGAA
jgi:hypothetical protein